MFEQFVKMPHIIRRLRRSKFKSTLDKYADFLVSKHYSKGSIRHYRNVLEHFFNWLELKKIPATKQIDEDLVNRFINKHVPICECSIPAPKRLKDLRAALSMLLKIQKEGSKSTIHSRPISKKDKLINEFDSYLINICGLSENTRRYHLKNLRLFLGRFFKKDLIKFSYLTPMNVLNFLYKDIQNYKRRTFGLFVYSIRTFFKFLQLKGIGSPALIKSLPKIIEWKSTGLPYALNKEEVRKILRSFDRNTDLGKRNYAIVICILELGLRAGEVANLKLDEINWRDQTINLPRGKTRQNYILPMTSVVADAIIDYLKYGRPKTTSRQIFVYHHPPGWGKGILPKIVVDLIRKAIMRSGLRPITSGSNVLRRTFATNLLRKGATIKEISDLLRHRSINTTAIYTKVDFPKLAKVALPWLPRETP